MASPALLKSVTSARFTQTRLLLQMGADVNCQDCHDGQTPLMRALTVTDDRTRTSFLRLLLRSGALVSKTDFQGQNAVMRAMVSEGRSLEDVLLLLRNADPDFNVNSRNKRGQTALWLAAESGEVELVRQLMLDLLKDELPCEVADHQGVTPAMRAAVLGHFPCVRTMVKLLQAAAATSHVATVQLGKVRSILNAVESNNLAELATLVCRNTTSALGPNTQAAYEDGDTSGKFRTPVLRRSKSELPAIRIYSADGLQVGLVKTGDVKNNAGRKNAISSPRRADTDLDVQNESKRQQHNSFKTTNSNHNSCNSTTNKPTTVAVTCRSPGRSKTAYTAIWNKPQAGSKASPRCDTLTTSMGCMSGASLSSGRGYEPAPRILNLPPIADKGFDQASSVGGYSTDDDLCSKLLSTSSSAMCSSGTAASEDASGCPPQGLLLAQIGSVPVFKGSVRDSLPGVFDLIAQQISRSYRKSAVRPPSSRGNSATGAKWSRLRGMAMLTRAFGRKTPLSSSGKGPSNGRSSSAASEKPAGLAGLLASKRKQIAAMAKAP